MILTDSEIRSLVEKGLLVQDMVDPDIQIQQCGVDLTVAKVYGFEGESALDFTNEKRRLPEYKEIPMKDDQWVLDKGVYHVAFNERIVLPKNIAGLLMPRSSALTCGIVQHTAVWDPGYEGSSFFHVEVSRRVRLYRNARLGQMVFFRLSGQASAYEGTFKNENIKERGRRG